MGKKKDKRKKLKPRKKKKWEDERAKGNNKFWKHMAVEDYIDQGDLYCDIALNYMAEGKTRYQLAQWLGVTPSYVNILIKHSEQFAEAIEMAENINKSNDLKYLRTIMKDKDVNSALVKLYFNEVYGITDRPVEKKGDDKTPMVSITYTTRTIKNEGEE